MAQPKLTTKLRKSPTQERSRATVDAIMQSATYILNEAGWSGLNTNAIAERAGVNISSLYQYFPNKQAVIAELQRRHATFIDEELQHATQSISKQPTLRAALKVIVEMVIREHRISPETHKAISEELPQSQRYRQDGQLELQKHMRNALQPFMKNVPDSELAMYIVGISIKAIVHQVTNEHPELLNQSSLVDEMITLIEQFLIRE